MVQESEKRIACLGLTRCTPMPTNSDQHASSSGSCRGDAAVAKADSSSQQAGSVRKLAKIDAGTFGVIYKVELTDTAEICAMKSVKIDPHHIQREMEMTKLASAAGHPNIVGLRQYFHSQDASGTFLNIVLEFVSTNLKRYIRSYVAGPCRA